MKAHLFILSITQAEIVLANGTSNFQDEGESLDEFKADIIAMVKEDEGEDLEIIDCTEKVAKRATSTLKKQAKTAKGYELKLIHAALKAKGVEIPSASPDKGAKTAAKPKPKAEAKPKKEKAPKPTLEEVLDEKAKADYLVGSVVTFLQFRTAIEVEAEVKQVIIDKRVNKAYFRLIDGDGKILHIAVARGVTVNEEATKELKAAKAKIIDDKEAAKKKKAAKAKAAKAAKTAKDEAEAAKAEAESDTKE